MIRMHTVNLSVRDEAVTLRRMVERKLREAIAQGVFAPGQRLIERDLCERLGVGRTSLREAFRQLEADGIIEVQPHRGPVVRSLTVADAGDLYELRAELEGLAASNCAKNRSDALVIRLESSLADFAQIARSGQGGQILADAKDEFYGVLFEGSGNRALADVLGRLHNQIGMLRIITMSQPGRLEVSITELEAICTAIESGKPAVARKAAETHVRNAARIALPVIAKRLAEMAGSTSKLTV